VYIKVQLKRPFLVKYFHILIDKNSKFNVSVTCSDDWHFALVCLLTCIAVLIINYISVESSGQSFLASCTKK